MNKERIEELIDEFFSSAKWGANNGNSLRRIIITAINETKEEDAQIAGKMEIRMLNDLLKNCNVAGNVNGCAAETSEAILASKIKEQGT